MRLIGGHAAATGVLSMIIRTAAACAVALAALAGAAQAKTFVYCSEGSPSRGSARCCSPRAPPSTPTSRSTTSLSSSSPAPPRSRRCWPRSWDASEDGTTFTFHLRHNAKWQSNANFKPTRDFNADDVLFTFERQWKEDNPTTRYPGGGFQYFGDMNMPKLLEEHRQGRRLHDQDHAERRRTRRSCPTWRWTSPRSSRRNTPMRC